MKAAHLAFLAAIVFIGVSGRSADANPIPGNYSPTSNLLSWGSNPSANNILVKLQPGGASLALTWTDGVVPNPQGNFPPTVPHPSSAYGTGVAVNDTGIGANNPPQTITVGIVIPKDPNLKDYNLLVTYKNGETSDLRGIAITNTNPLGLASLNNIPGFNFNIPVLTTAVPGSTIYEAVDLTAYLADNPLGPVNGQYGIGDTVGSDGISIVNGQIPGIQGLFFATTDFGFDPNTPDGYVPLGGTSALLDSADFQSLNGPILIGTVVSGVPEPPFIVLFGVWLGGIFLGRQHFRIS